MEWAKKKKTKKKQAKKKQHVEYIFILTEGAKTIFLAIDFCALVLKSTGGTWHTLQKQKIAKKKVTANTKTSQSDVFLRRKKAKQTLKNFYRTENANTLLLVMVNEEPLDINAQIQTWFLVDTQWNLQI